MLKLYSFILISFFLTLSTALAADEAYAVYNIQVSAQNENINEAKSKARSDGQAQAFGEILKRMLATQDQSKIVNLLKSPIAPLIKSMDVRDEKIRSPEYSATLDIRFHPDRVKKFLNSKKLIFFESGQEQYLIIPTYLFNNQMLVWDEGNLWASTLKAMNLNQGVVKFILVTGDTQDQQLISNANFLDLNQNNNANAFMDLAKKYNSSAVFIAEAAQDGGDLRLNIRRIDNPNPDPSLRFTLRANTLDDLGKQMIDTLNTMWKEAMTATPNPAIQKIGVHFALPDLKSWLETKEKLAKFKNIQQIDLVSVARNDVYVMLTFKGTYDELKTTLEAKGIQFHAD